MSAQPFLHKPIIGCRFLLKLFETLSDHSSATIIEVIENTMTSDGIEFRGRFMGVKACMKIVEIYPYCIGGESKKYTIQSRIQKSILLPYDSFLLCRLSGFLWGWGEGVVGGVFFIYQSH